MKNPFYLLVVFIGLLSLPLTIAAPVTSLDINFLNSPATSGKDLNFQATWAGSDANILYWSFDTDGNVQTGDTIGAVYLNDDFEDADISDWNVVSGAWSATGGNLVETAGGTGEITRDTGQDNNWSAVGLDVNFTVHAVNVAVSVLDTNTIASGTGYRFTTSGAEIKVKTVIAGVETDRLTIAQAVSATDLMRVTLDINGLITVYQNGIIRGSVVDTNFTVFRFVNVDAALNAGLKAILIQSLAKSTDPIESGASQTHTFNTSGLKTIQLTVQNSDGNASTSLDINVFAALNITVFDENTGNAISGATIDFNSGTYTTPASGNVNIALSGIAAQEFLITIDVNADYGQKKFIFDLNEFSGQDLNALMLQNSQGTAREYQVFQPNGTTKITNSIIEWRRTVTIPNGISQRTRTDSDGKISFLGQQDANYVMRITDATAGNILRDYNGTLVTVKVPLDISNFSTTITPFDIQVGGLALQTFDAISADQTFRIFSDTVNFYTVAVAPDNNTDFSGTSFLVKTLGGKATETLQPFFVSTSTAIGLTSTIFTINNSEERKTVPGIRIESFTDINGTSTLVESRLSDITGTAQFHFELARNYDLFFYDPDGVLLFSGTLTAKSTDNEVFAFLDLGVITRIPVAIGTVIVQWNPAGGFVTPDADGNVSVFQILSPFNTTIGDVNVFITHITDTNIVYSRVFTLDSNVSDQNLSYEIDINGMNRNQALTVNLRIFDTNNIQIGIIRSNQYSFASSPLATVPDRLRDDLGIFVVSFFTVLGISLVAGFVTKDRPRDNNNWLGVPIIIFTGFFMLIGWIPADSWFVATMLGVGLIIWRDPAQ